MSNWEAVLTAALIGTERAVVPPPPPGFPGDQTSQDTDPAAALLDHAALLTAARRAGRLPDHVEPPPAAEPDPRPMVSPAAGRRLARILGGENSDLLVEWLTAVAVRGLRPPAQFLPALLDRARRSSSVNPDPDEARLRGLVAVAGGSRARWLAGLNPAWAYLLAEPVPAEVLVPRRLTEAGLAKVVAQVEAVADASSLAGLMAEVPAPWPSPLTARVLTKAARGLSQTPLSASRVIRQAGRRADPALGAPGALAEFPPQAPNSLHTMLAVLRFRYEMLKELGYDHRGT